MKWIKLSEGSFALQNNNNEVGTMTIRNTNDQAAECFFEQEQYLIRRTGFWKTGIEAVNKTTGATVLTAALAKWYSNKLTVDYNGEPYELKIHNNPLAEWVLERSGRPVLAYGLDVENSRPQVRITAAEAGVDILFHFLLWYLFCPIAQQDSGDEFAFRLLLLQ